MMSLAMLGQQEDTFDPTQDWMIDEVQGSAYDRQERKHR